MSKEENSEGLLEQIENGGIIPEDKDILIQLEGLDIIIEDMDLVTLRDFMEKTPLEKSSVWENSMELGTIVEIGRLLPRRTK